MCVGPNLSGFAHLPLCPQLPTHLRMRGAFCAPHVPARDPQLLDCHTLRLV